MIRALQASIRRTSLRVDSWVLTRPITGNTIWVRPSRRIVPVVNRTDPTASPLRRLNFGKPIAGPPRLPVRESRQFFSAAARSVGPEEYASFE